MSYYKISNLDIKMTFISNEASRDDKWMHPLFKSLMFFAENRVNKYNFFYKNDDVLQEAYLGLWAAICTFDHHKNFDFYRWAQWHISSKIRDLLSVNLKNSCEIPTTYNDDIEDYYDIMYDDIFDLKQALFCSNTLLDRDKKILYDSFFLGKTLSEIADDLSISIERVRQLKNRSLSKLKVIFS